MLHVAHLRISFGDHDVLRDVTFEVGAGQRVGLVGANGVGKSTILKAIVGITEKDAGTIHLAAHASAAYLPQDAGCDTNRTLQAEMLTVFAAVQANESRQRALEAEMRQLPADHSRLNALVEAHARLQEEFERLGGYEVDTRIGRVLSGLGFTPTDYDQQCRTFSGGWQMRIALAKLLLQNPDLLLLDEPTNHLDLAAVEWLESYLRDYRGALIVVSHDRFFLDRVTQRTIELEGGMAHPWPGNYSQYLSAKAAAMDQQTAAYERQQTYLRQQEAFIERFRASARRSAQAKSREKLLAKLDRVAMPTTGRGIHFHFPRCRKSAREVLTLEGVGKSYDSKRVFANCELALERGDRVALVGENGAGKTTLLRLIVGEEKPDFGQVRLGQNVRLGYYAQHQADNLNVESPILDEIYAAAPPDWTLEDVRDLLGSLLISGDAVFKTIGVLSGGERSRVALAKMLLQPANLLLLDEPTNHLDIPAREMLETALSEYEGTVVLVSHDRYFIARVANRIVEIGNGVVRVFDGDYAHYRDIKDKEATATAPTNRVTAPGKTNAAPKTTVRERKPSPTNLLDAVEREIASVEQVLRQLEQVMADPGLYADGERVKETVTEYNDTKEHLNGLTARWEELALAVEAAGNM